MADETRHRLGLLGARGHVGAQLIDLIDNHPTLELGFASSRALAGRPVRPGSAVMFEALSAEAAAERDVDAYVLALPNGIAATYVEALGHDAARLLDLSADHRFDDAWVYGMPERFRDAIRGSRTVANPGCYATAAQLTLAPIVDELAAPPHIFGVSGYSGAGTTPSPKNDPSVLHENILPYALAGHLHEREISRHLQHPVHFMPHVASFFRGILLTISCPLERSIDREVLQRRFEDFYANEPLVVVQDEAPRVRDAVGDHRVHIGGITSADKRCVLVATIDNLLKGAATQALQNLNLMLGLDELCGIDLPVSD